MRADRLLSLMMLLQSRQQMTAKQLAAELEVSTRTIYRDIDALSTAGVPIYAEGGPGGGYGLLDSYRTTLTGLNESEVQALFMVSIPSPIADLGISQELKGAILKVTSTLNNAQHERSNQIRQRLHLDAAGWFQEREAVPHLKRIQTAVWEDERINLSYQRQDGTVLERIVSPYGLVAKAAVWYLVADGKTGLRVYRVSRILKVEPKRERFDRPADFVLADFWDEWIQAYQASLPRYPVTLRVAPEGWPTLSALWRGDQQNLAGLRLVNERGWREVTVSFERLEEAQAVVLGMGSAVEVIEPAELRVRIVELAAVVVRRYLNEDGADAHL